MNSKKIPDAELDVMMVIWDADEKGECPVTSEYIMERLSGRHWAKTTLLNLLMRLAGRGFVKCEKSGRFNVYSPLAKRSEYLREESKSFLKKLHHGSLSSLVASLYDGGKIPEDDIKKLEKLIEEAQ